MKATRLEGNSYNLACNCCQPCTMAYIARPTRPMFTPGPKDTASRAPTPAQRRRQVCRAGVESTHVKLWRAAKAMA